MWCHFLKGVKSHFECLTILSYRVLEHINQLSQRNSSLLLLPSLLLNSNGEQWMCIQWYGSQEKKRSFLWGQFYILQDFVNSTCKRQGNNPQEAQICTRWFTAFHVCHIANDWVIQNLPWLTECYHSIKATLHWCSHYIILIKRLLRLRSRYSCFYESLIIWVPYSDPMKWQERANT